MVDKEELKKAIKKGTVKDENTLAMFLITEKLKKAINVQDGHTPTEDELLKLIKPLVKDGKPGKDAKTPTKKELLSIIRPLIARITVPTAEEVSKLVPVPEIPKVPEIIIEAPRVRDALETLQEKERLDISAISGLEKELSRIKETTRRTTRRIERIGGGSTARSFYQLMDTPENYSGKSGYYPRVKTTEDGLEYYDIKTYIDNQVSAENLWDRADGTLTPHTANDNIDLGSGNFTTTGTISTTELFNTAGDLKIMPDVQGNVVLFGDTDVGNEEDGKKLTVHRKAAEFDRYVDLFINKLGSANMYSSGNIVYQSGGYQFFLSTDDIYFNIGDNKKAYFRTSASANLVTIDEATGKVTATGGFDTSGAGVYNAGGVAGITQSVTIIGNEPTPLTHNFQFTDGILTSYEAKGGH